MTDQQERLLSVSAALGVALMLNLPNKVRRLERELVTLLPAPTPEELAAMRITIPDDIRGPND